MSNEEKDSNSTPPLESEIERLTPFEERQITFYGDEITAALVNTSERASLVYVPVRPLCDYLGLSWAGQSERIRRDPVLSDTARFVRITRTNLGGNPNMLSLPLEMLPGWLFGVQVSRVKPELQDKIIRYQKECFTALWYAFQNDTASLAQVAGTELTELDALEAQRERKRSQEAPGTSEIALLQIREMGLSIARMAEQQLELEHETRRAHDRLDSARQFMQNMQLRLLGVDTRLHEVEERVNPPNDYIMEEQVAQIGIEVKALANYLTRREATAGRNPKNYYSGIFDELHRRFAVSSYRNIRIGQYPQVMRFLADWKKAADDGVSDDVFLQGQLF